MQGEMTATLISLVVSWSWCWCWCCWCVDRYVRRGMRAMTQLKAKWES